MKCFNHTEREAVATCQKCGKGLCRECAEKYTPCMCDTCAAQIQRDQQKQAQSKEDQRTQKYKDALVDTRSEFIKTSVIGILIGIFLYGIRLRSCSRMPKPVLPTMWFVFSLESVFHLVGNSLHICNRSFHYPFLEHFGFGLYME